MITVTRKNRMVKLAPKRTENDSLATRNSEVTYMKRMGNHAADHKFQYMNWLFKRRILIMDVS